jgi:hypothetical protein
MGRERRDRPRKRIFDASNSYDLDLNRAVHLVEAAWWDFTGYWQTWSQGKQDIVALAIGQAPYVSRPVSNVVGDMTPVGIVPGPESIE